MLIRQVVNLNMDILELLVDSQYLSFLENEDFKFNNLIFLVATDELAMEHAGYALFNLVDKANKSYELIHIQVSLEYQGGHLGTKLLKKGIEMIKESGGKVIKAPVLLEDFGECEEFFKKAGFIAEGEITSLDYSTKNIEKSMLIKESKKFEEIQKSIVILKNLGLEKYSKTENELSCEFDEINPEYSFILFKEAQPMGIISFFKEEESFILSDCWFNNKLKEGRNKIFTILLEYAITKGLAKDIEKVSFNNVEESRLNTIKNWLGEPDETVQKKLMLYKF